MPIRLRTAMLVAVLSSTIAAGCSSSSDSSLAPSGWGSPVSGAVIAGLTVDADGHPRSGLTVSVEGTSRSATVDDDGRFEIAGVPSGAVSLRFRDANVNATTTLGAVSRDQFVEIRVQIGTTSAQIVDEERTEKVTLCHRSEDGAYHRIDISVNAEETHRGHGDAGIGEPVPGEPTKTFDARCRAVGPSVHIEKSTNGEDADDEPGPEITLGSPVNWSYVVTNDGTVALSAIAVSDDQGVTVACGGQTTLAPGASMTCTGQAIATLEGQYGNVGTVTASWTVGSETGTVSDSDPSHYVGISPLTIEKLTNGEDADHAPGPSILVGDPVTWEYVVSNIGTVPLTGISVTDDRGVAVDCGGQTTVAPGASMTCVGAGTAVEGQYRNVGTATATWTNGPATGTVSESDPSHYLGTTEEEAGEKVSLCHRTGAGFYVPITVSINAEPAHLAHGDGRPGGSVPALPGRSFTAGCGIQ